MTLSTKRRLIIAAVLSGAALTAATGAAYATSTAPVETVWATVVESGSPAESSDPTTGAASDGSRADCPDGQGGGAGSSDGPADDNSPQTTPGSEGPNREGGDL